jgi:hypothetical protein
MKVIITNYGPMPICVPGLTSVDPGATKTFIGKNVQEGQFAIDTVDVSKAVVRVETEISDRYPTKAVMAHPANPAAGAVTIAGVGATVQWSNDPIAGMVYPQVITGPVSEVQDIGFAVFTDIACTIPATTATLTSATTGSIVSGAGTWCVRAKTSSGGVFACSVNIPVAAAVTLYLKAFQLPTSTRVIDSSEVDDLVFTV